MIIINYRRDKSWLTPDNKQKSPSLELPVESLVLITNNYQDSLSGEAVNSKLINN